MFGDVNLLTVALTDIHSFQVTVKVWRKSFVDFEFELG